MGHTRGEEKKFSTKGVSGGCGAELASFMVRSHAENTVRKRRKEENLGGEKSRVRKSNTFMPTHDMGGDRGVVVGSCGGDGGRGVYSRKKKILGPQGRKDSRRKKRDLKNKFPLNGLLGQKKVPHLPNEEKSKNPGGPNTEKEGTTFPIRETEKTMNPLSGRTTKATPKWFHTQKKGEVGNCHRGNIRAGKRLGRDAKLSPGTRKNVI